MPTLHGPKLPLLLLALAPALMGEGCPNERPFPSYAGEYHLETVQYSGSDTEFPFEASPPEVITVAQDILNRGPWSTVNLVILDATTRHFLMDGELNDSGALVDDNGRAGRSILESHSVSDTSSAFLGDSYACSFVFGATIGGRVISPPQTLLLSAYPPCIDEVTSRGTLCVMPRSRDDLPVHTEAWRAAGEPRLSLTFVAFKSQTHNSEYCNKPSADAQMTLTYVRSKSAAVENVDLRMSSSEALASGLTALINEMKVAPDGAARAMGLPETAAELRALWPIEPGTGRP